MMPTPDSAPNIPTMHDSSPIAMPETSREIRLPEFEGWPEAVHDLERREALAINTALATGRPLLVRGEPGTGKTQLARAAAVELKRHFVYRTLDARTEIQDLFWRVDAVRRLAEAQIATASERERLDVRNFVEPGVFWWGFGWANASKREAATRGVAGRVRASWVAHDSAPAVVLIDEIDKADPVLPNALLEVLGTGRFDGPPGDRAVSAKVPPLVVITTNEERELSAAFMRRCVVLELALPKAKGELTDLLLRRAKQHLEVWRKREDNDPPGPEILTRAVDMLVHERDHCSRRGFAPPGQDEYLALVKALWRMEKTDEARGKLLDDIAGFVLEKHPESDRA